MSHKQDQIYIDKVLTGNAQAFAYLLDKYKDFVFTIAVNIVKNREDAEDIAQESFVKAFNNLKNFKGDSKFSTWLYTITFRTAISATRKNNLLTSEIETHVINNYEDDGLINQIDMLANKDQAFYIKKALKDLPEIDALVLTLYYLNENSTEEIEEITGMTKSNIKVRLHRARKKLAMSIEKLLSNEMASFY